MSPEEIQIRSNFPVLVIKIVTQPAQRTENIQPPGPTLTFFTRQQAHEHPKKYLREFLLMRSLIVVQIRSHPITNHAIRQTPDVAPRGED